MPATARRRWPWHNAVIWWDRATRGSDEAKKKTWYAEARKWYEKAQAAQPDDLRSCASFTDFFVQTKQIAEAECPIGRLCENGARPPKRRNGCLGPADARLDLLPRPTQDGCTRSPPAGSGGRPTGDKAAEEPEDLRVQARVLEAQRTVAAPQTGNRDPAIIGRPKTRRTPKINFCWLVSMTISGDWPKARENYRELNCEDQDTP